MADLPAIRQSGEIGRRAGFRILCLKRLGSSTLPSGTRLWQAGAHGLGPCGETLGGSSPLSGTKGDRKGRRCPRPPSRPAPQRPRTGKIRAGKSKEVREKARKFTFLIKKGARYRSQKNKTKITKIP